MDLTSQIKRKMHGQSDKKILSAQGQSEWMQKPSGFPPQNPIGEYYGGKGRKVMKAMRKQYGAKKGKQVFYATAHKKGKR